MQCYYNYFTTFCGFWQANNICNINNRTLDLVMTTLLVNDIEVNSSEDYLVGIDSHHPPLDIKLKLRTNRNLGRVQHNIDTNADCHAAWRFIKCNFLALYEQLRLLNWDTLYEIKNPESALTPFLSNNY